MLAAGWAKDSPERAVDEVKSGVFVNLISSLIGAQGEETRRTGAHEGITSSLHPDAVVGREVHVDYSTYYLAHNFVVFFPRDAFSCILLITEVHGRR